MREHRAQIVKEPLPHDHHRGVRAELVGPLVEQSLHVGRHVDLKQGLFVEENIVWLCQDELREGMQTQKQAQIRAATETAAFI